MITAKYGQLLLIANASPADRGDLVGVYDTLDELLAARVRCGYHPGVLSECVAGRGRPPRLCEVDDSEAVNDEQLIALLREARAAGDAKQMDLCRRALNGDDGFGNGGYTAFVACASVIRGRAAAAAQGGES